MQRTISIQLTDIPSSKPAVHKCLFVFSIVVIVSAHNIVTLDKHLAIFGDFDLIAAQRNTNASWDTKPVAVHCHHGTALGDTIAVQHGNTKTPKRLHIFFVQGRTAGYNHIEVPAKGGQHRFKQTLPQVDSAFQQDIARLCQYAEHFILSLFLSCVPNRFMQRFQYHRNNKHKLWPVLLEITGQLFKAFIDAYGISVIHNRKYAGDKAKRMVQRKKQQDWPRI